MKTLFAITRFVDELPRTRVLEVTGCSQALNDSMSLNGWSPVLLVHRDTVTDLRAFTAVCSLVLLTIISYKLYSLQHLDYRRPNTISSTHARAHVAQRYIKHMSHRTGGHDVHVAPCYQVITSPFRSSNTVSNLGML